MEVIETALIADTFVGNAWAASADASRVTSPDPPDFTAGTARLEQTSTENPP
ncbi:hypothetical protein [Deinococcus alpinitundrae]|uniref:hypothetical protein n=1 Tax=Deinococcus alpinitundrae TaxID=468913 RepID=UPI001379ECD3|nr:hypothetical protein [Deinococcus alpinitundrae]